MGFAVLPQPADATRGSDLSEHRSWICSSHQSLKLADDADKLAAAIDLAQEVTGPAFSQAYVAENYALGRTDQRQAMLTFPNSIRSLRTSTTIPMLILTKCEIYDSYITNAVWDVLNTDLQSMMNGEKTPEEVAQAAQEAYEANY